MPPKTGKVTKTPTPAPAAAEKAGRPGRVSNLPEDVPTLLKMLGETEDQKTKRNIRARLRSKGHRGGLGRRGRPKKDAEAANTGKGSAGKTAKASKKPRPVETEDDGDE